MEKEIRKNSFKRYMQGEGLLNAGLAGSAVIRNTYVARPQKVEDVEIIINGMRKGEGFVVDFDNVELSTLQRMLDILSGAVFALEGRIERIKDKTYLITSKDRK